MKAVVEIAGKQYVVEEGAEVFVDRLDAQESAEVVFDKVMLTSDGDCVAIGEPVLEGASVKATVLKHGKNKKIIVFKYKAKKNYKRKRGHRAFYTKIRIDKISA